MSGGGTTVRTQRGRSAASAHPRPKGSRNRRRRGEALAGYAFLIPWFLGLVLLVLGPMAASLYLSFTDYDLFHDAQWVGAENYQRMMGADPKFWQSLKVTGTYVLVSVPIRLIFALAVAVILNRALKGAAIYRAVLYLPSMLAGSVAIAMLWRQIFGRNGAVNAILAQFGITGPSWIADPRYALGTIIILAVWQFGSPMIIFLAGLRGIPVDLLEAAQVDGAGPLRRFFSIVMPLLTPIVFFNLVMQTIVAFQAFTPAYIISNGSGGPVQSTLFYTLYLYQEAFTQYRMGYASALAWVLVAIIAVVTAINFLVSRRWVFYSDGGRP